MAAGRIQESKPLPKGGALESTAATSAGSPGGSTGAEKIRPAASGNTVRRLGDIPFSRRRTNRVQHNRLRVEINDRLARAVLAVAAQHSDKLAAATRCKTTKRHTSTEFVDFLADVVASQPLGRQIHVIADNLSAHKTKLVEDSLAHHPQVRMHFTPTYSSWLNQVEIWFAKIQRQVIARGIFSSVDDLRRKILRYIRHYNKTATPIKWTYSSPAKRINA